MTKKLFLKCKDQGQGLPNISITGLCGGKIYIRPINDKLDKNCFGLDAIVKWPKIKIQMSDKSMNKSMKKVHNRSFIHFQFFWDINFSRW